MAQRYFHKRDPKISITLPDGTPWKNWTLVDHENGIIAPQNDYLAAALVQCVREGVGGVTEISEAEFRDWEKKKQSKLPPRWRDEWVKQQVLPSTEQSNLVQNTTSDPSHQDAQVVAPSEFRPAAVKD